MNAAWHRRHALPRNASLDQRLAWHREHQERCACRPVPPELARRMQQRSPPAPDPAIDEYLARVSARNRKLLQELRKTIRTLVPEAEECISYRIPAFRLDGRIIAGFAATSKGCSYYPFSGATLGTLAADLRGYEQTRSALHFGAEKRLTPLLVRKLLKARLAEKRPKP